MGNNFDIGFTLIDPLLTKICAKMILHFRS